jgi:prevent-host-death family protein
MNAINANELKIKGVSVIAAALENEQDVTISVRGKPRFIVMGMDYYRELREYELKIAVQEAKADIAAGRYVIETANEHIDRIIREYDLQPENA